jgi:hypothetical protein
LAGLGISEDQLLRIAPYSPDFSRPIEHAFGTLKASFRNYLYTHGLLTGAGVEPRRLQEILYECFMKITPASVMADVVKLPDLWDVVRSALNRVFVCLDNKQRKGTAGEWPKKISGDVMVCCCWGTQPTVACCMCSKPAAYTSGCISEVPACSPV